MWCCNLWINGSYKSVVTVEGEKEGIESREIFRMPIKNKIGNEVSSLLHVGKNCIIHGEVTGKLL